MNDSLKERVYKFIKSHGGGISFVELRRAFPEFSGDKDFGLIKQNIVFWSGISEEFVEALQGLIKEKRITVMPTTTLVYVMDGSLLGLPIAKRPKHKYKSSRWLPVVFNLVK